MAMPRKPSSSGIRFALWMMGIPGFPDFVDGAIFTLVSLYGNLWSTASNDSVSLWLAAVLAEACSSVRAGMVRMETVCRAWDISSHSLHFHLNLDLSVTR